MDHRDTEPLGDVLLGWVARIPATRAVEIGGLSHPEIGVQPASVLGVKGPITMSTRCTPAHLGRI